MVAVFIFCGPPIKAMRRCPKAAKCCTASRIPLVINLSGFEQRTAWIGIDREHGNVSRSKNVDEWRLAAKGQNRDASHPTLNHLPSGYLQQSGIVVD